MRENLLNLTRDFTSICSTGDIIYLGTPQTTESIYNTLPGRGFTVRIWPGRFPNAEQMEAYGDQLCPVFRMKISSRPDLTTGYGPDGLQGAPVDPVILGEAFLNKKEIDQGTAYFQLQHMLQTQSLPTASMKLRISRGDSRNLFQTFSRPICTPYSSAMTASFFICSRARSQTTS